MTNCKCFEDMEIWQLARLITVKSYKSISAIKDYGFKDQMQRAAVSIMNNIAEGFEHRNDKEFARFLYYSKASCGELRSMLYLAQDLEYISEEVADQLRSESALISRKITTLIKYLNKSQ